MSNEYEGMDKEQALKDGKALAEHVLTLEVVTEKGQYAKHLARVFLGINTLDDRRVPIVTNGTLRLLPPDEPVFLLRAQDLVAADTVRDWAGRALRAGAKDNVLNGALDQALKMDAWPVKKVPDHD